MTNSKIFSIISKVQLLYKRLHLTIWRCTQVAEGLRSRIQFFKSIDRDSNLSRTAGDT